MQGWCSHASKSSPLPAAMTNSPSTTHRSGSWAWTAATTSGKYLVSGFSLRLPSSTSSPSRNTMQRKPSHLGSYKNFPTGMSGTLLASIGFTGGITGSCMQPS